MIDHVTAASLAEPFDPNGYAVPVGYWDETGLAQGTGFLARSDGQVAFYTAAHNLTGTEPVATDGWVGWTRAIEAFPELEPGSDGVTIKAFVDPDCDTPTENFAWSQSTHRPGYMVDAIRFDPVMTSDVLTVLEARYRVIDLDTAKHDLGMGEHLTCVGFPRRPENPDEFPYCPPDRRDGRFLGHVGGAIQAEYPAVRGFSGGPVFTADGLFVGMHVGGDAKVPHPYLLARIIAPHDVIALGAGPVGSS